MALKCWLERCSLLFHSALHNIRPLWTSFATFNTKTRCSYKLWAGGRLTSSKIYEFKCSKCFPFDEIDDDLISLLLTAEIDHRLKVHVLLKLSATVKWSQDLNLVEKAFNMNRCEISHGRWSWPKQPLNHWIKSKHLNLMNSFILFYFIKVE